MAPIQCTSRPCSEVLPKVEGSGQVIPVCYTGTETPVEVEVTFTLGACAWASRKTWLTILRRDAAPPALRMAARANVKRRHSAVNLLKTILGSAAPDASCTSFCGRRQMDIWSHSLADAATLGGPSPIFTNRPRHRKLKGGQLMLSIFHDVTTATACRVLVSRLVLMAILSI